MAEFGEPEAPETFIPPIAQEALVDIIGTTRSRVGSFANRFCNPGFITYKCRIQAHESLLNVVLLGQLPERNAEKHVIFPTLETDAGKLLALQDEDQRRSATAIPRTRFAKKANRKPAALMPTRRL